MRIARHSTLDQPFADMSGPCARWLRCCRIAKAKNIVIVATGLGIVPVSALLNERGTCVPPFHGSW